APPEHKVSAIVVDFMTLRTETSHWYLWGLPPNFAAHDEDLTVKIRGGHRKILADDLEVLESQQRNLQEFADRRLLALNIDAGGVGARRIIDKLIAAERETAAAG